MLMNRLLGPLKHTYRRLDPREPPLLVSLTNLRYLTEGSTEETSLRLKVVILDLN